jgi:hypothetical protein
VCVCVCACVPVCVCVCVSVRARVRACVDCIFPARNMGHWQTREHLEELLNR